MIGKDELTHLTEELLRLFEAHLGIRQPSFEKAVKRAGRRLPRRIRKHCAVIFDAFKRIDHPHLASQIDESEVHRAVSAIKTHLQTIDRKEAVFRARLRLAGTIAFNLLAVAVIVFFVLRYRGFL